MQERPTQEHPMQEYSTQDTQECSTEERLTHTYMNGSVPLLAAEHYDSIRKMALHG
ncbi:10921_t:CDS:2 [Gigaspora rosea]|nr:10921_t:CDS:2 [Gigaspora rosea]